MGHIYKATKSLNVAITLESIFIPIIDSRHSRDRGNDGLSYVFVNIPGRFVIMFIPDLIIHLQASLHQACRRMRPPGHFLQSQFVWPAEG